ncbi:hypothetical protein LOK49_LG05G00565 [Camellia lanceoleosa]|uniref:Uncharacterized protein n=1 Tax=Camellia lanceoleosa TaxID=1840588 RepID=A0ACC0HQ34_9ERIC|nr:hypothetical protein LOK49_LG05G00565 [Camellia lanceoleosa]
MAEAEATVEAIATAGQDLLQEESELLSVKRSEPGATVDVPCQRGLLHLPPKQGSTAQHLRRRRTSSERDKSPSPKRGRPETEQDRSDYSESPRENSRSPVRESPAAERYQSPSDANGRSRSRSPTASPRDDRSPVDDDANHQFPRVSE